MSVLSTASLLVRETKASLYNTALGIAASIGLPVSSWQPGDPTRALFGYEADVLGKLEDILIGFIASGFLDSAKGIWLKILAEQVFGVEVPEATQATTVVRLTNNGGGYYPDIEPGDLIFKNVVSGKTYTNTTGGTLASGPGTWLDVTVVADEAGSDSSAGVGEIAELVTTKLGVTCSNATVAVGNDEQSEDVTRLLCRAKLGMLSPNGPKEAYTYVAMTPSLAGTSAITRPPRVYASSDTGDVLMYLATAAGAVLEADRALVEAAILKWATPLCITPTVASAGAVPVNIAYELWIYKSVNLMAAEIAVGIESALEQLFATRPIGGDIITGATTGALYRSLIQGTIRSLYSQTFRVDLSSPAADVALLNNQVATLGTVTPTIHIVVDP